MGRHYDRGAMLFDLGRFREAIEEFTLELGDDPQSKEAFGMRAVCHCKLDRLGECYDDIGQAIALDPDWSYSYYVLSIADLESGRRRRARQNIHEALRLEKSPTYYYQLALVEAAYERVEAALGATEAALALDPGDVDSLVLRAKILNHIGRLDEARQLLETAITLAPENPETHSELGAVSLQRGSTERALGHLVEARRMAPDAYSNRPLLAETYGRLYWPFRQIDRFKTWIGSKDITVRWVLVNTSMTLGLVILAMATSSLKKDEFSWTLAAVFGFGANAVLLLKTNSSWGAFIALFRLRRELDMCWQDYVRPALGFAAFVLLPHYLATVYAPAATVEPAIYYLLASFLALNWDWYGLVAKKGLKSLVLYPLLAVPFILIAFDGTTVYPQYPVASSLHWAMVLAISFACMWGRRSRLAQRREPVGRTRRVATEV